MKVAPNKLLHNRYGFVVGKVIDKRSTHRNELKRRFRAQLEVLEPRLEKGYDILFILRKPAVENTTEELREETEKVLLKMGLLATQ